MFTHEFFFLIQVLRIYCKVNKLSSDSPRIFISWQTGSIFYFRFDYNEEESRIMNSMELNDLWMFIYGFPGTYPRKIIIFDLFRSIEDNPINCGSFMTHCLIQRLISTKNYSFLNIVYTENTH